MFCLFGRCPFRSSRIEFVDSKALQQSVSFMQMHDAAYDTRRISECFHLDTLYDDFMFAVDTATSQMRRHSFC